MWWIIGSIIYLLLVALIICFFMGASKCNEKSERLYEEYIDKKNK